MALFWTFSLWFTSCSLPLFFSSCSLFSLRVYSISWFYFLHYFFISLLCLLRISLMVVFSFFFVCFLPLLFHYLLTLFLNLHTFLPLFPYICYSISPFYVYFMFFPLFVYSISLASFSSSSFLCPYFLFVYTISIIYLLVSSSFHYLLFFPPFFFIH